MRCAPSRPSSWDFRRARAHRAHRGYFGLCERELNKRPATPRTVEERLTAATAALNNGQDEDAAELVRSVLGDDPKHDLALYLLAAVHARKGDLEEALSLLGKAIAITPEASPRPAATRTLMPFTTSKRSGR
jgi:tetratricopeptide (TPR) repeat protein